MRILQCPVPGGRLDEGVGATVADTLSYFALMALAMPPLIDDGAGDHLFRGAATVNPPCVSLITAEAGLLLVAKDVSTLRRGLAAYPGDEVLKSDSGGLGMIATTFERNSRSTVGKLVSWGVHNAKQSFLHPTFRIGLFFSKYFSDYVTHRSNSRKMNDLFVKLGGGSSMTFEEFRRTVDRDAKMQDRCAMILICRTGDIAPGLEVPNGRVMRYIAGSVELRDVASLATRAFGSKERQAVSGGIFT